MGAKLRVYKRRIRSVTATKKITKAMEMIAASRVVKAQRQVAASTPYASELTRAVTAVATGSNTKHPLTTEAEQPTRAAVLLITSDRGLAGGYSSNVIKAAEQLTERLKAEGKEVDAYIVGRKGVSYYSFRERKVVESWTGFTDNPTYADAKAVAAPLIEAVQQDTAEGGVDELHIVSTEFISMMTQTAIDDRLLPLSLDKARRSRRRRPRARSFRCSTSSRRPRTSSTPCFRGTSSARIYNALLQAAASKHAATRRAMKSATDNAEDLIKSLSRLANAARQAEITQEISEIVGGASALADATAGSD